MVVPEVAKVDGLEQVGGAAAAAVLGVGCMGHAGKRERVVVDAEVHDPCASTAEVGEQGSSALSTSRASRPSTSRTVWAQLLCDRLELAVAVELVAE